MRMLLASLGIRLRNFVPVLGMQAVQCCVMPCRPLLGFAEWCCCYWHCYSYCYYSWNLYYQRTGSARGLGAIKLEQPSDRQRERASTASKASRERDADEH